MRILVTGANGLVGSRLCALLASRGHEVTGVGRGERRAQGPFTYRSVELTRGDEVFAAVDVSKPEAVVHTASMTEVDACERAPQDAYAANVDAARFVAEACRAKEAHLLHVSTDYVFDGDAGPYSEDDLPNPRGVYATTKLMGELAVRVFAPSWAIARTAVVYGWPPAGRPNFGSWLVSSLEKGQSVKLFEDQWVSPSLADNVAAMLAELTERKLPGVWNTCGAEVVDRVTFGKALCEVFGFDTSLLAPSKMKDVNLPSPRPAKSGLLTAKAARELSAKPVGLAESLRRFHQDWARTCS
ncbi:MAG: SDR family oxidoreductase [Myxococcota bacterium]